MDANAIIADLGGDKPVASATGCAINTVAYWRRRDSIPADYWEDLLSLAPGREGDVSRALIEHRSARLRSKRQGVGAQA